MMSNSTLPLGFLHSNIALAVELFLVGSAGGCDEVDKFYLLAVFLSENRHPFFYLSDAEWLDGRKPFLSDVEQNGGYLRLYRII